MTLPLAYQWLAHEPAPNMLLEALGIYGVKEAPGAADNPVILGWAQEVGCPEYKHDATAWCGLTMAVVAKRAGWDYRPLGNPLWALNWSSWGDAADKPMLGDVLTFVRPGGGGHVGQYVGEDDEAFHVLGGNTGDAVSIGRVLKSRLHAARRAPWKLFQPKNVRVIKLARVGILSENEA